MPESTSDRESDRASDRASDREADGVSEHATAIARYVAAHAFACWAMYDGRGIRGALGWLKTVRATLEEERRSHPDDLKEAMRLADLRLRHAVSAPDLKVRPTGYFSAMNGYL